MSAISGDRPLAEGDVDRLGFAPLAGRLARAMMSQASPAGLVVGVEGAWGSGKSSLIYLMLKALREGGEGRPEIVEFRPWLVGDRDALLTSLFGDLAKAIAAIELSAGDATKATNESLKSTAEKLRSFAAQLEGPGKALRMLGDFVPGMALAGGLVASLADAAKSIESKPALSKQKDDLNKSLGELPRRIVVTIDDVDRLEPDEAIELLRLIRSVADFPNVIYVLCYDQPVLAQSVRIATRVRDGRAYLEKIIQIAVPVPMPEPFDLRRWFSGELATFARGRDDQEQARIEAVIDSEGGRRLTTPRAVVRALNSLAFVWPALKDEVDLADLIWLHLIRAQSPTFYRWIESYCAEAAVNTSWRVHIGDAEKERTLKELRAVATEDGSEFDSPFLWKLGAYIPGIQTSFGGSKDDVSLFVQPGDLELRDAIRDKRLKSPDHYRLYFALSQPESAPRQADYDAFRDACGESPATVALLLRKWGGERMVAGTTKLDVMLNRMREVAPEALAPRAMVSLYRALSDAMDDMILGSENWDGPPGWRPAERLMPAIVSKVRAIEPAAIVEVFEQGRSIHWLTNLLRDELAAVGKFGDRQQGEPALTEGELEAIVSVMKRRYAALDFWSIIEGRRPGFLVYAWKAIDPGAAMQVVREHCVADADLLQTLKGLAGRVITAKGQYDTLTRDGLSSLLDFDEIRTRVEAIAAGGGPLALEAAQVGDLFRRGDQF